MHRYTLLHTDTQTHRPHTHTHTHTHTQTHTYTHRHTHRHTHINMHIYFMRNDGYNKFHLRSQCR